MKRILLIWIILLAIPLISAELPQISENTCLALNGIAAQDCNNSTYAFATVEKNTFCCMPPELDKQVCIEAKGIVATAMQNCPNGYFKGPLTSKSFVCCIPISLSYTLSSSSICPGGSFEQNCSEGLEAVWENPEGLKCCVKKIRPKTDEEYEAETYKETRIMNFPYGAEVRLLQLKKAINKNIVNGKQVIAEINSSDTKLLESLLGNLSALIERIEDLDMNQSSAQLAAEFVNLKNQAKNITWLFRQTASKHFSEIKAGKLRLVLRHRPIPESASLKKAKAKYNMVQFKQIMKFSNMQDASLIRALENHTVDIKYAKKQLINLSNGMGKLAKQSGKEKLKNLAVKRSKFVQNVKASKKILVNHKIRNKGGKK